MTGILIIVAVIVLLIAALEPAHRRGGPLAPRLGADTRHDTDRSRTAADLRAAREDTSPNTRPARIARMLGRAGSAVPLHRAPLSTR